MPRSSPPMEPVLEVGAPYLLRASNFAIHSRASRPCSAISGREAA